MTDDFEDHCWKDVITPDVLEIYSGYRRKIFVGRVRRYSQSISTKSSIAAAPAAGQARQDPSEHLRRIRLCGDRADQAVVRGRALAPACRFSIRPATCARRAGPVSVNATKRNKPPMDPSDYAIRPEFKPQPHDVVITKQRASVFFGTPLVAHLTQLGVQTLIICGESTSGCVRATAVDAYSHGYHVVLVEECCFDRSILSHKINLFDMHHKYVRRDARQRRGRASRRHGDQEGELRSRLDRRHAAFFFRDGRCAPA